MPAIRTSVASKPGVDLSVVSHTKSRPVAIHFRQTGKEAEINSDDSLRLGRTGRN